MAMYNKIRDYVNFKLRNDRSKDHLEKSEEIISNLSERYDELYQKTSDKEFAYIETIKTIGDFIEEESSEASYKPEIAEMMLISATILSVIGLIATMISNVVGIVIVGISITLYAVGAVYLYQLSKFSEREEYDIDKYQLFLNKTFSYMKTNFTFWALSLSLMITSIIYSMLITITIADTLSSIDIDDLYAIYLFSAGVFVIILAIIGSIFILIYRKLMRKYRELSGQDDVESIGMKAKNFLSNKSYERKRIFNSKYFYPVLNGLAIIFLIYDLTHTLRTYVFYQRNIVRFIVILEGILIVLYLTVTILNLFKIIKYRKILPIFNIFVSIAVLLICYIADNIQVTESIIAPFYLIWGILFVIILFIDYIRDWKRE